MCSEKTGGAPRSRAENRIRRIAIIGGGSAAWMAASSLSRFLRPMDVDIRVVESEQIGTISVGEASLPPIIDFIRQLGIDENDIVRAIGATFKLGIGFRDWTRPGDVYFHPFGPTGFGIGSVPFPAYWLKMFLAGKAARLEDYSMQAVAAEQGKFTRPVHAPNTPLNKIAYALHFDAQLFARYLRRVAEANGAVRTEGKVRSVCLRAEDGFIESVILESGERIDADLFIDCTGFRGLLIEEALKTGYEDWSRWLPCDRAVVMHSTHASAPLPYTLVSAQEAGWQWRIPLQHRMGNGYVYGSGFMSDDAARQVLVENLEGTAVTDSVRLCFRPGRRRKAWNKNCVSLGLASGFLEPLEATNIHLTQRGIAMLLKFFPDRDCSQADTARYNKILEFEYSRVRDFLLMHYKFTERPGAFWQHCRRMPMTDSLQEKVDLFLGHGRILREDTELFPVQSWLSVMIGQGLVPRSYDPMTDSIDARMIEAKLDHIRSQVRGCAEAMPLHHEFISNNCLADTARPWAG